MCIRDSKGLKHLTKLKSLKQLLIYNTKVNAEGYRQLHKVLPDCFILYGVE